MASPGQDSVTYRADGPVAVIGLDDGKANALSPDVVAALSAAVARARDEVGAVVLHGRPGRLSAGFDLSVMTSGPEPMRALVGAGAELLLDLFTCPIPVVIAGTGHALAAGALLLLVADTRVGADIDAKIGLNEVAIGLTLPIFGVEFARYRLAPAHFEAAAVHARIYDPSGAVEAGYLDRLAPEDRVIDEARAEAARLADLPSDAFRHTKKRARSAVADLIRESLARDMAGFQPPSP
jgi:enoyl-CoA hydratase